MASKRHIKRKSCLSKSQYDSQGQANTQVRFAYQRGQIRMHSYKCSFCKKWHIGHY